MSGFLESIRRHLRFRKRTHAREERDGLIHLFGPGGLLGPAQLLDESSGGARILCEVPHHISAATHMLNPEKGEAHKIEFAWTNGPSAGVKYLKTTNVRGYVDAEFEPMKAFWTMRTVRHLLA